MRKFLVLAAFAALIVILAAAFQLYLPLDWLVANELELRETIRRNPLSAWFIGLAAYFGIALVPGTTGKAMIAGWLFGFWPGVLMVDLALTAAAVTTFWVGRFAFRDFVQSRFRSTIERIDRGLVREGAMFLLLVRLVHAPYTVVNYACGATSIRTATFAWTAALGLLPGTLAFVFAGTRLPTLAELLENGPLALLDPWLIGGLILTATLPLLIRFGISRLSRRSIEHVKSKPIA